MKSKIIVLISMLLVTVAAVASATPFTSTMDFYSTGTYKGQSYSVVNDLGGSSYVGEYSHTVMFDPAAASVASAQLELFYALTTPSLKNDKEVWFISGGNGTQIGVLTAPANNLEWQYKSFNLPSNLLAGVSGTSWSIAFKFDESSEKNDAYPIDFFYLDKSVLSGEYAEVVPAAIAAPAPVPEPGTMMLLGSGLLGLAVYGKRRRNK